MVAIQASLAGTMSGATNITYSNQEALLVLKEKDQSINAFYDY